MIYTKTGDDGTTSLGDGQRVRKDDARIEALGTLDELNAQAGLLAEMLRQNHDDIYLMLKNLQTSLFDVQTMLAIPSDTTVHPSPHWGNAPTRQLEQTIDRWQQQLPQLTTFVVAGGNMASAQCHVVRCVCRRAERCLVALDDTCATRNGVIAYINRLSDFFFVLSRWILHIEGIAEDYITVDYQNT